MICFIEWLRAIATALVANSHFKGVYPTDILSFGGGFGLALFYMISGYLLVNIREDTPFAKWYFPKLVRLYIPLWLFRTVELLVGYASIDSLAAFFKSFIFPGSWFGGSMVILYAVYFLLVRYWLKGGADRRTGIALVVFALAYCILFTIKPGIASFSIQSLRIEETFSIETPYLITQFVWLSCMVIGYWIRKKGTQLRRCLPAVAVFVVSVLAFLGTKLLTRGGARVNLQFILGPVYVAFAISLFLLLARAEQWFQRCKERPWGKLVGLVSMCSLEIYYVQFIWIDWLKVLVFPVNLIVLTAGIVVTAYILHRISNWIVKRSIPAQSR